MAQTPSHILGLTRAAFRQEADELLTELDTALLELEALPGDEALLNRAFRATHTLKGSGATAGYENVSSLLHGIEDVFNDARDGKVRVTSQTIDLVLKVSDCVRKLLQSSSSDAARHLEEGREVVRALQELMPRAGQSAPHSPAPPSEASESAEGGGRVYEISFAPEPRIFHSGNDPLVMLRDLLELGAGAARANTDAVPPFAGMDPELCYLSWDVQVASDLPERALRDVFMFVEDDAKVAVSVVPPARAWVLPSGAYFNEDLVADFLEESAEELQEIESCVLALEENPSDAGRIDPLFRALHNLKGQSRLLLSDTARPAPKQHPLRALSQLAHAVEGFVEVHRSNARADLDDTAIEVLLHSVDWLKLLRRDFVDARPADAVPAALLASLLPDPTVRQTASNEIPQSSSMLSSVASQCREVLGGVFGSGDPTASLSASDVKLMTRALETLTRAATFDKATALRDRTSGLLALCRSLPLTDDAPVEIGVEIVGEYQGLLEQLARPEPTRASRAPGARGRTISIRPSRAPKREVVERVAAVDNALAARTIRVDQAKLDRLMRVVGELLVARNSLPTLARRLDEERSPAGKDVKDVGDRISHIADDLQDTMMAIRMMPIRTVFQRFPRMIRDLARSVNKQVQLIIQGEDTELDKTVLEQLADPLVHLVRNAVDHGLETPEERTRAGKPELGTVGLMVTQEGNHVVIRITDDGRGMNPEKLCAKAVEKGILDRAEASAMTPTQAFQLIFRAGFSTAETVTSISGRGVGMDVVQNNVRQLHGTITVESEIGKGTTFTVKLPASLMVSKGILVEAAGDQYIVPIEGIREMIKVGRSDVHDFAGREFVHVRGAVCPLLSLATLLGLPDTSSGSAERSAAIVSTRDGQVAIVVDKFVSEIDVIVKPLSEGLNRIRAFQGASILGDGRVALVMDPTQIVLGARTAAVSEASAC